MLSKLAKDMPSAMAPVAAMLTQGVPRHGARAANADGRRPTSAMPDRRYAALLSDAE
jgi:hypothetical protein